MPDVSLPVREAFLRHEAIEEVKLIGSRLDGRASLLSDWDFEIETSDPEAVSNELPALTSSLEPIVAQWDRLAYRACYMLLLRGPIKVDVMLNLARPKEPAWIVSKGTIQGVDDHFWDWILWMASKDEKGYIDKVNEQLALMQQHLLGPLGVPVAPTSVAAAVDAYLNIRGIRERELGVSVRRLAEREVLTGLRRAGYGAWDTHDA